MQKPAGWIDSRFYDEAISRRKMIEWRSKRRSVKSISAMQPTCVGQLMWWKTCFGNR